MHPKATEADVVSPGGSTQHPRQRSVSLALVTNPARRRLRAGVRGACAAFGLALLFVPAFPAAANPVDPGQLGQIGNVGSPQGLSLPLTLLLFVGIPLVGFIIGALMAFRPSRGAAGRYRPGRPWNYEPIWFGNESALEREHKRSALPGAGGASGRW